MVEESKDVLGRNPSTYFPTLEFVFKRSLRGFSRPGVLALMGVLVPHVMSIPLNMVLRSYWRLLRDNQAFFEIMMRLTQGAAILGALSFIVALRVVLRPRKINEVDWDINRTAAAFALVVFAASIMHFEARSVYY